MQLLSLTGTGRKGTGDEMTREQAYNQIHYLVGDLFELIGKDSIKADSTVYISICRQTLEELQDALDELEKLDL